MRPKLVLILLFLFSCQISLFAQTAVSLPFGNENEAQFLLDLVLFSAGALSFITILVYWRSRKREKTIKSERYETEVKIEKLSAQQKGLKKEIKELQSKIALSHKLVGLGFWEYDHQYNRIHLSDELLSFLGIKPDTFDGHLSSLLDFVSEKDLHRIKEQLLQTKEHNTQGEISHKLRLSHGEIKHVQQGWEHHFGPDGTYFRTVGTILDITNQTLIEEENRKSQRQLRTIIDSINAMIYMKDCEGTFLLVNKSFEVLSGNKEDDIIGKNAYEIFPETIAKKLTQRENVVINKGFISNYEESHKINRRTHIFSTTKVPLFDSKGDIYGLVGMSIDITGQKKMEGDLIKAKNQAEKAFRSKSEFLANMSHEIRTPLNAVTGFSELLQDIVEDAQQKNYLNAIKTAGKTLLNIINDILDLSKLEAGKLELNSHDTSIPALFDELKQIFQLKAKEKGLSLTFFYSNLFPPFIELDSDRLKQILLNLIGNALKFTEKGAISISAEAIMEDERIIITVKDTGIGIKANAIEAIFNDFEQQSGQDSRKYGGTGLGLSISKRLINLMDGEIFAQSREGAGATFTLSLPLKISLKRTTFKNRGKEVVATFKQQEVWIVEDSESNRILLDEALKIVDLKTRCFTNGPDVIEALSQSSPDLILTDFQMPAMNGIELLQEIKKSGFDSLPIIVLTTLDNIEEYQFFTKKGFDHCLQKPIEIEKLYDVLATYLEPPAQGTAISIDTAEDISANYTEALAEALSIFEKEVNALQGAIKVEAIKTSTLTLQNKAMQEKNSTILNFTEEILQAVQQFDVITIRSIPERTKKIKKKLEGGTV